MGLAWWAPRWWRGVWGGVCQLALAGALVNGCAAEEPADSTEANTALASTALPVKAGAGEVAREFAELGLVRGVSRSELPAGFRFPAQRGDALEATAGGLRVSARPVGELGHVETAELAPGLHGLVGGSAAWLMAPTEGGAEDFLRLPRAESSVSFVRSGRVHVSYELGLDGVAGLRLVSDVLEFLDAAGVPRLRMRAPFAVDTDARRWPLELAMMDCHVDTNSAPPWGRAVTPPGADVCRVELSFDGQARFPVWVDPGWTTTGALAIPRSGMARLDGSDQFLAIGGLDEQGQALDSVEAFDRQSYTWAMTGALSAPRTGGELYLVHPWQGLLVGGGLSASESYDSTTGAWTPGPVSQWPSACSVRVQIQDGTSYLLQVSPQNGVMEVEYLALEGNVWQRLAAGTAPGARTNWGCSSLGTGMWLVGGEDEQSGAAQTASYVLDTANARLEQGELAGAVWRSGPDIAPAFPNGVSRPRLLRNALLGGEVAGAASSKVIFLAEYNGDWVLQYGPDLPAGSAGGSLIWTYSNRLWSFGGRNADGSPSNAAVVIFPANPIDGWGALPGLSVSRQGAGVALGGSSGDYVVFGGRGDSGVLGVTEVYHEQLARCSTDAECFGTSCVEGVCCEALCEGTCMACERSRTGRPDGECAPVLKGQDSYGACPRDLDNVCGLDGTCDGQGQCLWPGAETECGSDCSGEDYLPYVCSGSGECVEGPVTSCRGYACRDQECLTECWSDGDCQAGYACWSGRCTMPPKSCNPYARKPDGSCKTACSSDADCELGFYCSETSECWAKPPLDPIGDAIDNAFSCDCCCTAAVSGRNYVGEGALPMLLGLLWLRRRRQASARDR